MNKHKYEITINNAYNRDHFTYDFRQIRDITLSVGKQKASIKEEIGSLRTAEDIISFRYDDFRDAYRKAILIHALKFNEGLKVNTIKISVDDKEYIFDRDNDPIGHFPYMFSMIEGVDLGLDDSWKTLINSVMKATKTNTENDLRFAAMYSFLASKSRTYFVDQFANLWTAINAYYTYITKQFESRLMKDHDLDSLSGKLKISGRDAESMGLASWLLDPQYTDLSDRNRLRNLWIGNYEIENTLRHYSVNDIKDLYKASKNEIETGFISKQYENLKKRAAIFDVKLYPFLLFVYPYNLRCKYFHGNSPTILIASYNDYEISALETVNYFMTQFLNENIPKMFKEDFWTDREQEAAIKYIEYLAKGKSISILIENHQKEISKQKKK